MALTIKRFPMKIRYRYILLLGILIIGAGLRFNGIKFGLPLRLHPDEHSVVDPAINVVSNNTLETNYYFKPLHYSIYISAISYKLFTYFECNTEQPCGDITDVLISNESSLVFISRSIVAFQGTFLILTLYILTNLLAGNTAGILVAGITAFFPSFIQHSHYATADIPLIFLISLAMIFSILFIKQGKWIFLLLGIIFCSLATLEKYPGLLSTVVIIYAIVKTKWNNKLEFIIYSIGSLFLYLIGLIVFSPLLIMHIPDVIQALIGESRIYHLGASGLGFWGNLGFYWKQLLLNFNLIFSIIFLLGLSYILYRLILKKENSLISILILFGFTYWILLSYLALHWERWGIPMYLMPIVIVGITINEIYQYLHQKKNVWIKAFLVFIGLVSLPLLISGIRNSVTFNIEDTRNRSLEWINSNLPPDSQFAYDGYTPIIPGIPQTAGSESIDQYKTKGVDYIVTSSYMFDRYLDEPDRYPDLVKFYNSLETQNLISKFEPINIENSSNDVLSLFYNLSYISRFIQNRDDSLSGPRIYIYDIR